MQGIRSRAPRLATIGVAGMLACRQEYAIMLATFAFLPARDREGLDVTLRWRRILLLLGLLWFFIGFFGYLRLMTGREATNSFIDWLQRPKAPLRGTAKTSLETLALGMGAWAVLACLVPRIAILAVPWIVGPCGGDWEIEFLGREEWHFVRYVMPMACIVLAGGLVGYARLGSRVLSRPGGWAPMILIWAAALQTSAIGLRYVVVAMTRAPVPIDRVEAQETWPWILEVKTDDAVLADYKIAAPLSSRRLLYSTVMDRYLPGGFPLLGPEIRWLFIHKSLPYVNTLLGQGFEVVHRGAFLTIAHRAGPPSR
jgi:hypothetical protein